MTTAETSNDAGTAIPAYDPYRDADSLEFKFRAKRFRAIQALIEAVLAERGRCDILDLGGTETYWLIGDRFIRENRCRITITIVNTEEQTLRRTDQFRFLCGDATKPDLFAGRQFDLVHSNSLIEHVGSWRQMAMFAANVRRLASRYYVQTPNYWFPYEPHFRVPGFQFLPKAMRARLIMRYALGFFPRITERSEANQIVLHHQLLSTRQMRALFPDGVISHEKFMRTNKSIIATRDRKHEGFR